MPSDVERCEAHPTAAWVSRRQCGTTSSGTSSRHALPRQAFGGRAGRWGRYTASFVHGFELARHRGNYASRTSLAIPAQCHRTWPSMTIAMMCRRMRPDETRPNTAVMIVNAFNASLLFMLRPFVDSHYHEDQRGDDSLHGRPSSLRRTHGTLSHARHIAINQRSRFVHLRRVSNGRSSEDFPPTCVEALRASNPTAVP